MIRLSELVGRAVPYERLPAPIDHRLRLGAWVGLALTGSYTAAMFVVAATVDSWTQKPGFFVVGWTVLNAVLAHGSVANVVIGSVVTALALSLAIHTRGFARGSIWMHHGALGVTVAGAVAAIPLVVALAIVVFNVALWVLYGAVLLLLGILAAYMIFGGLWAAFTGELS